MAAFERFMEQMAEDLFKERAYRDAAALKGFEPKVIFFGTGTSFENEDEAIEFLRIGRDMFDAFPLADSAEWYGANIRGWEIYHSGGSFFVVTAPKGASGMPLDYVKRSAEIESAHAAGRRCGNADCMECY